MRLRTDLRSVTLCGVDEVSTGHEPATLERTSTYLRDCEEVALPLFRCEVMHTVSV